MNIKTTLILLVLLLGLGAVLLITRDKGGTPASVVEHNLLDVKAADVTKLTITDADGKTVAATKAPDASGTSVWQLTQPVHAATDTFKVASLVEQLATLHSTASVDAAAASGTGVDKPRYTAVLTAGDKNYTLKVGDKLAVSDGVYVRVGDQPGADVVSATLLDTLARPVSELRKSQLFDANSSTVQQITVAKKDGSQIVLEKQAKGWQMLKPTTLPADQYATEDLISAVTTMQPVNYVDDTSTVVGMTRPAYTVQFSTMAPTTRPASTQSTQSAMPGGQTVVFGGFDGVEKKNVFAKLPDGTFVTVAAGVVDSLNKKPLDLRDKTVFDFDPETVTAVAIATDQPATTQPAATPAVDTVVKLSRRKTDAGLMGPGKPTATGPSTAQAATAPVTPPTKWAVDPAHPVDADDAKIDALLAQLHPLKAEKYEESAPVAKAVKTVAVTLTVTGKPPVVLTLTDTGVDQPLSGLFDGLRFDAPRTLESDLSGDFKKSSAAPTPVPTPSFGGRPGGFQPGGQ